MCFSAGRVSYPDLYPTGAAKGPGGPGAALLSTTYSHRIPLALIGSGHLVRQWSDPHPRMPQEDRTWSDPHRKWAGWGTPRRPLHQACGPMSGSTRRLQIETCPICRRMSALVNPVQTLALALRLAHEAARSCGAALPHCVPSIPWHHEPRLRMTPPGGNRPRARLRTICSGSVPAGSARVRPSSKDGRLTERTHVARCDGEAEGSGGRLGLGGRGACAARA